MKNDTEMPNSILSVNVRRFKSGRLSGFIRCRFNGRIRRTRFIKERSGHAEQFGATTDVLCFTYRTFEKAVA